MTKGQVDSTLVSFVSNLVYITLLVFIVIAALGQLGIQTTSFIAVIGAAGLAIGLALQGSLANFAAGFLLIIFRPFKEGDFIEHLFVASTHDYLMFFTDRGKCYWLKVYNVPEIGRSGRGRGVRNLLELAPKEQISAIVAVDDLGAGYSNLNRVVDLERGALDGKIEPVEGGLRIGALATLSRNFQMGFLEPIIGRDDVEVVLEVTAPEGVTVEFPEREAMMVI